jgi:hypothetical protein
MSPLAILAGLQALAMTSLVLLPPGFTDLIRPPRAIDVAAVDDRYAIPDLVGVSEGVSGAPSTAFVRLVSRHGSRLVVLAPGDEASGWTAMIVSLREVVLKHETLLECRFEVLTAAELAAPRAPAPNASDPRTREPLPDDAAIRDALVKSGVVVPVPGEVRGESLLGERSERDDVTGEVVVRLSPLERELLGTGARSAVQDARFAVRNRQWVLQTALPASLLVRLGIAVDDRVLSIDGATFRSPRELTAALSDVTRLGAGRHEIRIRLRRAETTVVLVLRAR